MWKIYNHALGIELTELESFSDFNLDNPTVRTIVDQRWPAGPPMNESVVSPASVFESPLLVTVYEY